MDKRLIAAVSILLILMVIINISFDSAPEDYEDLVYNEFESDLDDSNNASSVSNDIFTAETLKNLTDSTDLENKLLVIQTALKNLSDQNLSLEKQLNQAENKTSSINTALNKLSDKIALVPASISSLASVDNNAKKVSLAIVEKCETEMIKLYATKAQQLRLSIEQKLTEEPVDALWADELEYMLSAVIKNNNLSGTNINVINCHSSICEIIIDHDDRKSRVNFTRNLPKGINAKYIVDDPYSLTDNIYITKSNRSSSNSY